MIEQYLNDLVAIPSYGGEEIKVADYLADRLGSLKTHRLSVENYSEHGRSILLMPEQPSVILDAHLDTVPPGDTAEWKNAPFAVTDRDGSLHGLGVLDDKVNIALCLELLATVDCSRVGFVFAGGEEVSALGLHSLLSKKLIPKAQFAIALEATQLQIMTAHKGAVHLHLDFAGQAAHSSKPSLGINAIEKASSFIQLLEQKKDSFALPHPLLGSTTMTVVKITGGDALNRVPAGCALDIDVRLLPGQSEDQVKTWIANLLQAAGLNAAIITDSFAPAMEYRGDKAWLEKLQQSGAGQTGTVPYWTHSALYEQYSIPSVVFGPGDVSTAHTPRECIENSQLEQAYSILQQFIQRLS
ncbi:hypothetical protein AUK40_05215 [Candidatus Wirthbacteria bacterium CG2_30_54_11]|uniref:Peptidase M20 dimerisation domain-containing protein n=1 Tax=Candidatus Wirthbacteria bacterium CG2_30_54_11 TaxID=1817892 RepID=A0A1J5IGI3_9BACT|nr:MAG: hypothetical protein AUK40_05215 [Candidatus Wirthbacteria bacterium CG2_30_54_11]